MAGVCHSSTSGSSGCQTPWVRPTPASLTTTSLLAGGLLMGIAPLPVAAAAAPARYARGSVVSATATLDGAAVGGGQTQLVRRVVSGLTRAEATDLIIGDLDTALHRTVVLSVTPAGGRPRPLRVGLRTLLDGPFAVTIVKGGRGTGGTPITLPAPTASALRGTVRLPANRGGVAALLDRAAALALVAPVGASARLGAQGRPPVLSPGHDGSALDRVHAGGALLAAVRTGRAALPVLRTPAVGWGAASLRTVIVVHTATNRLEVFRGSGRSVRLRQTLQVATGAPGYPSPHGSFHVVNKQPAPSWFNPHDDWSAGLPDVIGPGPDNPLGTRALGLDSPGILIHGIPEGENASIGSNASHGCVRVRRSDIEALYPTVPVGTPVLLTS